MTSRRLLAFFILLSMLTVFSAATDSPAPDDGYLTGEMTAALTLSGVLRGDGEGLALERTLTRAEAATLVVRVMGTDNDTRGAAHPFDDVPEWASPYVSVLYRDGIVRGVEETVFGAAKEV